MNNDVMKKCNLAECCNYEIILAKCDLCEHSFCFKHIGRHNCPKTYNFVLPTCPICKKVMDDKTLSYDYESSNISIIKLINLQIEEINKKIESETNAKIKEQYKNRQSNISYIFNKNTTSNIVYESIKKKYTKELFELKTYKFKLILEEHQNLGCYSHKEKNKKCSFCKNKGMLITCGKCNLNFCISHRLPEVHKCIKI